MCSITARFTVYFEDPFWVGVIERVENGRLEAARIVFEMCIRDSVAAGGWKH